MSSLVVPMLVEAFLKNRSESEENRISLAAPNYRDALTNSFLGSNNTPQPFNLDQKSLRSGVHLHFVLPDAFTHADENEVYPAVPDRFFVTRLALINEEELRVKRFLVESNFISDSPDYSDSVTIPMFSDGPSGSMFRYLGRCYCEGSEPEKQGEYLPGLTAVGPGDPAFAAYYPNSSSVFGFHDDMEDVPEGAKLTYFVAGYFSDQTADPLDSVTDRESFTAALGRLGFSVDDENQIRRRTVVFGEADGILWRGADFDYGRGIPQGEIDVSVGNTSAEAFSAILKEKSAVRDEEERSLTALQYALLESAEEMDGNFKIDDGIHLQQFEALQNRAGGMAVSVKDGAFCSGKAYSSLRKKQEAFSQKAGQMDWERRKLFCLWEQYMYLYEMDDSPKIPSENEIKAEIKRTADRILEMKGKTDALEQEIEALTRHFTESLPEGISPKTSGGEPFYQPKEPCVMLSGSGLHRSFAFGEDGRYTQDNTLRCQTEAVTCNVDADTLLSCLGISADCPSSLPFADCDKGLLIQAVLLSASIRTWMEKTVGELTVSGHVSPLAVSREVQSFTTLFMDWSVRYYPTRASGAGESDNTLAGWKLAYGETAYTCSTSRSEEKNIIFTGRTVVAPHALYHMKEALTQWLKRHCDDEEAKTAAERIRDLPVLSQSLGGLNEQLCAKKQALQFPIMGNEGDEELAKLVEVLTDGCRESCVPSAGLYSLRGGHFRVDRLNLISTFGQIQHVVVPPGQGTVMQKISYAETLRSSDENYGLLSPAFLTPARLSFQWVSAKDNNCLASQDETTSPVCGFLLPEVLNRRLLTYTGDGNYVGTLKIVYRAGQAQARWLSAPGFPLTLEHISMDGTLKAFLSAMMEQDALSGLLKLIDVNFNKTLSPGAVNFLWGRPLVLARAAVSLVFRDGFAYTQDYRDFGRYNTQGAEQVRIPLHFGDAERVSDGLAAVFPDVCVGNREPLPCFEKIYPAWGMPEFENSHIAFSECPDLAFSDGRRLFTLLMEAGSQAFLQTGILPVKSAAIPEEYAKAAQELPLAAQFTCVLTTKDRAQLPILQEGKTANYQWCTMDKEGNLTPEEVVVPLADFADSYLCDGILLSRKEPVNGK